jgi:hypothetical protein
MNKRSWLARTLMWCLLMAGGFFSIGSVLAGEAQEEWKKIVEAAKKEGKIVAGGPPTAVLRQKYKETFEKQFGLELELLSAPGPQNAGRAARNSKQEFVTSMFSMAGRAPWNRSCTKTCWRHFRTI